MADTSNLTSFLEDIADAIRTKKVSSSEIPAANFDTEILSIETGTDIEFIYNNEQVLDNMTNSAYPAGGNTDGLYICRSGTKISLYEQIGEDLNFIYNISGLYTSATYTTSNLKISDRIYGEDGISWKCLMAYTSVDATYNKNTRNSVSFIEIRYNGSSYSINQILSNNYDFNPDFNNGLWGAKPVLRTYNGVHYLILTGGGNKTNVVTYKINWTYDGGYEGLTKLNSFEWFGMTGGGAIGAQNINSIQLYDTNTDVIYIGNTDRTNRGGCIIRYSKDMSTINTSTKNIPTTNSVMMTYIKNIDKFAKFSISGTTLTIDIQTLSNSTLSTINTFTFTLDKTYNYINLYSTDNLVIATMLTSSNSGTIYTFSVMDDKVEIVYTSEPYDFTYRDYPDYVSYNTRVKNSIVISSETNINTIFNDFIGITYNNELYKNTDSDNAATSNDIAKGKDAYVNGKKVIGNLLEISTPMSYMSESVTMDNQQQIAFIHAIATEYSAVIRPGYAPGVARSYSNLANDIGLTADKIVEGNTILGITGSAIVGDYQVKLFETQEEMNADTNPTEGDLAVVYREEIQNMTADTQTQYINFPETVTLLSAVTSSSNCMLRAVDSSAMFDGQIRLTSTQFRFNGYSDTGSVTVQYSSTDGINYTRTTEVTNPIDLGTAVHVEMAEDWNDNFGYFMLIGGNTFEGLYKYDGTQYNITETQLDATADLLYNSIAYGKNGVIEGTITQNVSNSFADINAEIYYKIQQAYDNMEPRVLTDSDKTIDKNIYFIPTNANGEPLLDTNQVTDMSSIFSSCKNLTTIPLLDTSSVTNMYSMFNGCDNLIEVPMLDTSQVIDMSYMFYGCDNLINIPLLNTSNVTNMYSIFFKCGNLIEIPLLDTGKVTNMMSAFRSCTSLISIPQLNTISVTDARYMFSGCTNLVNLPVLDTSNLTKMDSMFSACSSLSDDSLNNILAMCSNSAVSSVYEKKLSRIGLSEEQAQKCTTLSNWSACESAGWTTGY